MEDQNEFTNRTYPVAENMQRQQRAWTLERIGWYGLLLVVALTLLGLFSKGPLSSRDLSSPDGSLRVEYERFSRNGAQDTLIVTAKGKPDQAVQVHVVARLLEGVTLEAVHPINGPSHSEGRDLVIPVRTDSTGIATLYLTLRSDGVGLYRGTISLSSDALPSGAQLAIPRFIYP